MNKREERTLDGSCWNKAHENELLFILLERDEAAPATIRAWAAYRIQLGKNQPSDAQIVEALNLADRIEANQRAGQRPDHGGGMAGHDDD